jgi:hypothetical protein
MTLAAQLLNPLSAYGQYTSCEFIRRPISNGIGLSKIEPLNRFFKTNYKFHSIDYDKLFEKTNLVITNEIACDDLYDHQMIFLFSNELRVYLPFECKNTKKGIYLTLYNTENMDQIKNVLSKENLLLQVIIVVDVWYDKNSFSGDQELTFN